VVIPGLVAAGYEIEDARDYSVAACWEFIIPRRGMEVMNIGTASMRSAVELAIREGLAAGKSFERILDRVQFHLVEQVKRLAERSRNLFPPPYYSAGLSNFGIHGAASASAADALAAVKEFVFDQKSVEPMRLLRTLAKNSACGRSLQRSEKMMIAPINGSLPCLKYLPKPAGRRARMAAVTDTGRAADRRCIVLLARGHEGMEEPLVGATADGHKSGEFFSSSLAPSPDVPCKGP
jgi:pyruvate-formate lyase